MRGLLGDGAMVALMGPARILALLARKKGLNEIAAEPEEGAGRVSIFSTAERAQDVPAVVFGNGGGPAGRDFLAPHWPAWQA